MVQSMPVASFRVGTSGKSAVALARHHRRGSCTRPASISDRASGTEQGTMSTPPATRSCRPGAAPWLGTHGDGAGVDARLLQHAGERQMPDAALAGAGRLELARARP